MTRKDYVKIAALLKKYLSLTVDEEKALMVWLIDDFAKMMADDNPRFDRQRFLEAAGVRNEYVPSALQE